MDTAIPGQEQEVDDAKWWMSEDDVAEETTEAQTASDEISQTEDEAEDEYDEILYNKETVKIPKDQRKTLLQKGYNYDKVHGRLTEQEQKLARLRELTGMDIDAALQNLEQQIQQQQVSQHADQYGLTEEDARRDIEKDQRLQALEKETKLIKRLSVLNQEKEPLKDKLYFKELEPEIDQLVRDNVHRGIDISAEAAFKYLRGEKLEELMSQTKSKAEKQTLANVQDRLNRGRGLTAGSESKDVDMAASVNTDMAEAFGVDPKKIAAYVKKQNKSRS